MPCPFLLDLAWLWPLLPWTVPYPVLPGRFFWKTSQGPLNSPGEIQKKLLLLLSGPGSPGQTAVI